MTVARLVAGGLTSVAAVAMGGDGSFRAVNSHVLITNSAITAAAAVQIQRTLQGVGDGAEQFGVVARLWQCDPSHMVGEVEVRIVRPLFDLVERVCSQHLPAPWNGPNSFCQRRFE